MAANAVVVGSLRSRAKINPNLSVLSFYPPGCMGLNLDKQTLFSSKNLIHSHCISMPVYMNSRSKSFYR